MTEAKFILSKEILKEQVKLLTDLGLKISYSYKTNREVGNILQEIAPQVNFSIHAKEEIEMINDKSKISFFTQAESEEQLKQLTEKGIKTFVVDNEIDLQKILNLKTKINLVPKNEIPRTPNRNRKIFRLRNALKKNQ